MKIAHIGFGKTATTALQLSLFPRVADDFGLEYVKVEDPRIRVHASRLYFGKSVATPLEASGSFLVSAEDLYGWDPFFWEEYADANLRFLGDDCHILITVREPRAYLTSLYLQICLHEGNVQSANDFFLPNELYSPYNTAAKFAIDQFGYQKIIDLYAARFKNVTIVKYEGMDDLQFLKAFFEITEPALADYGKALRSQVVNKSFSARAVRLTFSLQNFLAIFGLSVEPNTVEGALVALSHLRGSRAAPTSRSDDNKRAAVMSARRISNGSPYFRWASLMHRLDRYVSGGRFELDFSLLPQIDLPRLTAEYSELPAVATVGRQHRILQ